MHIKCHKIKCQLKKFEKNVAFIRRKTPVESLCSSIILPTCFTDPVSGSMDPLNFFYSISPCPYIYFFPFVVCCLSSLMHQLTFENFPSNAHLSLHSDIIFGLKVSLALLEIEIKAGINLKMRLDGQRLLNNINGVIRHINYHHQHNRSISSSSISSSTPTFYTPSKTHTNAEIELQREIESKFNVKFGIPFLYSSISNKTCVDSEEKLLTFR